MGIKDWEQYQRGRGEVQAAEIGALLFSKFGDVPELDKTSSAPMPTKIDTLLSEGRLRRERITIGGKTSIQLQKELQKGGFQVSSYAKSMMGSPDFTTQKNPEEIDLVRLKVADLDLPGNPTTDQIYERAKEYGLGLCPAEVGPQMRQSYKDQPYGECLYIGMKQVTDPDGSPRVFGLRRGSDGLWLHDSWAGPARQWNPGCEFVVRLSPPAGEAGKSS